MPVSSLESGRLRSTAGGAIERVMDKRTTLALLLMAALLMIYPAIFMRESASLRPSRSPPKSETPAAPAAAPAAPGDGRRRERDDGHPHPRRTRRRSRSGRRSSKPRCTARRSRPPAGQIKAWDLHFRGEKPMVLPGTVDSAGWVVRRPGQPPRPIAFTLSAESIKLDKDTPTR